MTVRRIGVLCFAGALLAAAGMAQEITPSVLNVFRYGTGTSGSGVLKQDFTYVEELLDLRLGLPRSITVGLRFLYDEPPEVGPRFRGIRRRYVEFESEGLTIRAGNSSQLFGHGLALNLFEDRGLGYDTWVDGLRAGYDGAFFRLAAVLGTVEYRDSIVVARTETYEIRGGNVEVDPLDWLTLGASFVRADADIPGIPSPLAFTAETPEVYASMRFGKLDIFTAWSRKKTRFTTDREPSTGSGMYGAVSWTGKGYGVVLDYKDYRFDIRDPFGRFDASRPTRMLPIQNPPVVQREHSWTYLTRALHQVDFNDEVGIQMEGFFRLGGKTTLTVNASLSSEHDYFDYNPAGFNFIRRERKGDFLPSTDPLLSPYWEALVEGEHYFGRRDVARAAVARRHYTQAVLFTRGNDQVVRSTVLPGYVQLSLDDLHTVTLQVEVEWVRDNYNVAQESWSNQLIMIGLSRLPGLSLAVRGEFTSNPSDASGRKNWFAGEVGYRLGGSHTMVLTVGQERGGQVCANGVCRFIQPFSGVRFSMQTNI